MPQLNDVQNYALEIVDYLYFYDIATLETFSVEKKTVYCQLLNAIDEILKERNLTPQRFEIYKHYLLCGVEIVSTQDDLHAESSEQREESSEKTKQKRLEVAYLSLLNEVKNSDIDVDVFRKDVNILIISSEIHKSQPVVSRRLVSQVLWSEFSGGIAAHVYQYFLRLGILSSKKLVSDFEIGEVNEFIFLRAMLFIEFEILRNRLYFQYDVKALTQQISIKKVLAKHAKKRTAYYQKHAQLFSNVDFVRVLRYDLSNLNQVMEYLVNINPSHCHIRIFLDKNSKWVSLLGAWELMYVQLTDPKKAIYNEINNEDTCSAIASQKMEIEYGLRITARNLYLYSKYASNLYDFIGQSVSLIEEQNVGFIAPDLAGIFYYHPAMSEKVTELIETLTSQLK